MHMNIGLKGVFHNRLHSMLFKCWHGCGANVHHTHKTIGNLVGYYFEHVAISCRSMHIR